MNETGTKLLFRDQKLRLYMANIEASTKTLLLGNCLFVEWVTGSNVIVAQSQSLLHVWYHADSLDKVETIDIHGHVLDIVKDSTKTMVILLKKQLLNIHRTETHDGDQFIYYQLIN